MKIRNLFMARGLVLVALAFAAVPVFADTNRYEGSTWAFVDAKKALEAASEITLAKYPDCDEATVEKKLVRVYRADGTGESQDETFTKVLTEKGKRNNRTLGLSFMLPYFTVEVVKLEVLKPGGEAVAVDVAANSKETIDSSQMAMNIYDPNNKVLEVNIPGVEIGDVVHSVTRLTIQRPIIPGEFAEENVFEGQGLIRHLSYEVHAPLAKPLKRIVLRDEVAGTVRYSTQPGENSTTIHRWEVNQVPRMFDEPAMPPYEVVLQRLFVSTTPDWQSVSKWYWELSKPHLEATVPEMKKTVDELLAGAKTDLDKTKAMFYHVSKKIRYMGLTPEKDRPGYEPHDVSLTFGKKYGVCRDKAALLVSLLRTAGLEAYPGADQCRDKERSGGSGRVLQPRHRRRGVGQRRLCVDGPDGREHAGSAAFVRVRPELPGVPARGRGHSPQPDQTARGEHDASENNGYPGCRGRPRGEVRDVV